MTEDQIKSLLLSALSRHPSERGGEEALAQLATQFLVNQQRIADSLEKLAECVTSDGHWSMFDVRTTA